MELTKQGKATARRIQLRRIGAAAVAVFGVAAGSRSRGRTCLRSRGEERRHLDAKNSKYGTILVSGKTLYTLKPSDVACTAKC